MTLRASSSESIATITGTEIRCWHINHFCTARGVAHQACTSALARCAAKPRSICFYSTSSQANGDSYSLRLHFFRTKS